ncbi:MAG: DUF882 domain-containing protein, partial [Gemmatimonadaceae bacterium]|nr:DUF882 domain-containing protein [Gemmatimonadaceae bacterium]
MGHAHTRASSYHRVRAIAVLAMLVVVGGAAGTTANLDARPVPPPSRLHSATRPAAPRRGDLLFLDSIIGLSGKLRARFVTQDKPAFAVAALEALFGDSALNTPGVYPLVGDSAFTPALSLITLLPFTAKQRGRIGAYRLGFWPHERRRLGSGDDEPLPEGFIKVTPENQDTYVSEHFRLADFLTHDQVNVWPKYLVLSERLIDKLELVIEDLNAHGVMVRHMTVMSGFRTPEYNIQGVGRRGGRARDSRHQYGDAADVFVDNVDNNESGRMGDLNHDGRVDTRDAKVIRDAVDRVEAAHPELVGGVGI